MKEGFLFGLGFSLVYFTIHYASGAAAYYFSTWYVRHKQQQMFEKAQRQQTDLGAGVGAVEQRKDFTN